MVLTHSDKVPGLVALAQGCVTSLKEQFAKLPRGVRSLALSRNPKEMILFYKEASFRLINLSHHDRASIQAGANLIEKGLSFAKASGIHNSVTEKLHADYAYLKAWGIGTDKNTEISIENARQAGAVIDNYGARLLRILKVPANG